ncbi:hypothetical protein NUU61_006710 [Penicillium alfredii]|uniref:Uncharacterized protein n=1 Tax=Penicillium alfredii TaxID=1506179 RepID=A0A9W9F1Q7_9EURO|nr:uncharacterized protein NUU61_006710 [Penicillium alfredii]KAJ5091840.1 hypothetical protein NUU61_006710 [Penicillium alfredii]
MVLGEIPNHICKDIRPLRNLELYVLKDLRDLDITHLCYLHAISLGRVVISSNKLMDVVQQCCDALRRVKLVEVDLNIGAWAQAFDGLAGLPRLRFVKIDNCGYSRAGPTASLFVQQNTHRAVHGGCE